MSNNLVDFQKKAVILPGKFRGTSGFACAVGMCTCGNPNPLVLMLHPGLPQSTTCGHCGASHVLMQFSYNHEKAEEGAELGVNTRGPEIVRPS